MNRRFRILAAAGTASLLVVFLMYTALVGGDVQVPVIEASELAAAKQQKLAASEEVQLVGIATGPVTGTQGEQMGFRLADSKGAIRTTISYRGAVPDAFRVGRTIVIKGQMEGTGSSTRFIATPGSLQTKCPSKYQSTYGSRDEDGAA